MLLPEKDDSVTPFYKILNEIHQDTALYRRQVFYWIIVRNYQGPKIFIKSKIVRKCLRRRNNYLSKMPLKEPITEPTYRKYRGLTYVTKCKYAPNSFHSQPQAYPLCTTKPTKILLRFSLIFVLSYVFMFCAFPPPPPISQSFHHHPY